MRKSIWLSQMAVGLVGTASGSIRGAGSLVLGVWLDGVWLDVESARSRGLIVTECISGDVRCVFLENRSSVSVFPEELGWRKEGADDFDVEGLKVYLESWQMASPCGVRNWNDEPFDYSVGYLHNCVSTPSDFKPGEKIVTESLVIMDGNDTEELFGRYVERWAADSHARHRFGAPIGWCSWYYCFEKVTLQDVIENADWFKAHRTDGFERVKVIQLDDGYQAALGDWLVPNDKFPGGLKRFAGFKTLRRLCDG